jgi:uncharacterized SAM-binding protein YcdF (DUF218 family)/lysophospholipase L1-like esterase
MLALVGIKQVVDHTTFADSLVAPLITMDTPGRGDVLVVLGAGINERCMPNNFAIQRVLLGARLFREGRAPLMLITGGRARGGSCTVAGSMKDLAVGLGVPPDRILIENAARSTWQNALFSKPILDRLGARRIVLVTDRLHMTRSEACFRQLGYHVERAAVQTPDSHPDNTSMLVFAGREAAALAYYWLEGHVSFESAVQAAAPEPAPAQTKPAPTEPAHTAPAQTAPLGPPAAAADAAPPVALRHPQGPVVLLGASYAAGWHPAVPGVAVVNKGRSGQQTFELRERFARDVIAEHPRAVVIWGFVNDIFRAPREGVDAARSRAQVEIAQMVAAARAAGIEPILATEVPIRGRSSWSDWFSSWVGWALGKTSYDAYINGHVAELNGWLAGYAQREGILLLDLHRAVAQPDGARRAEFAEADGSHLTPAAYAALDRYAIPLLRARVVRP